MSTTLYCGVRKVPKQKTQHVINAAETYLREHGCYVDYLGLDEETGEIQIKATGAKVVIAYDPSRKSFKVTLC